MRTQTRLASQLPAAVAQVTFSLRWTDALLQGRQLPTQHVPMRHLQVLLERACWASRPPDRVFDLTPRELLDGRVRHPDHQERIARADQRRPPRLLRVGGTELMLDGLHRLARAERESVETLPCVWVPPELIRTRGPAR